MLDGTRDTNSNVQLGGNNLTGLTDLQRVVSETSVDGSTRSTDSSTNGVGKGEDDLVKVLLVLEATAARDDLGGRAQIGALGLGQVLREPLREGSRLGVSSVLDSGSTSTSGGSLKGG